MKLDKSSPLPRHFQLREAIKRDVLKKGLSCGEPIPSERELAGAYNVSRVTVRRAIGDLVEEGFLRRENRKGTFINNLSGVNIWQPGTRRKIIGALFSRSDTFFSERLLHGMDDVSHEQNYSVMFGSTGEDPVRAARQIERMADEGAAGLVVVPLAGENYEDINQRLFDLIRSYNLPFTLLDCSVRNSGVDTVVSDNFDGAYRTTQHLIELKRKRILFIGYMSCSSVEERLQGYQKCLRDNGIYPDEELIIMPHPTQLRKTIKHILEKRPEIDAVFANNDVKATTAWECVREMGRRVPDDVALAGYDNMYRSTGPGALLTTTDQPLYEEGKKACEMLLDRLSGHDGPPRFAVLKSTFIVGQSTVGADGPVFK